MTQSKNKPKEHSVLLRLPARLHKELVEKAEAEHRSTVGHLRYLIETDLKEAA